MGININSLEFLAQRVSKYAKACGVKSILQIKPPVLKGINATELKLAPQLKSDVVQLSKQAKSTNIVEEILSKDLTSYLDKELYNTSKWQNELYSVTYNKLKTPEERALYKSVLRNEIEDIKIKKMLEFEDLVENHNCDNPTTIQHLDFFKEHFKYFSPNDQKYVINELSTKTNNRNLSSYLLNSFDNNKMYELILKEKNIIHNISKTYF